MNTNFQVLFLSSVLRKCGLVSVRIHFVVFNNPIFQETTSVPRLLENPSETKHWYKLTSPLHIHDLTANCYGRHTAEEEYREYGPFVRLMKKSIAIFLTC